MEAHTLDYNTKVKVVEQRVQTPVGSIEVKAGDELRLLHVDGMYMNAVDKDGNKVYIAAWTEVELI